jgi:hypothetical protein
MRPFTRLRAAKNERAELDRLHQQYGTSVRSSSKWEELKQTEGSLPEDSFSENDPHEHTPVILCQLALAQCYHQAFVLEKVVNKISHHLPSLGSH